MGGPLMITLTDGTTTLTLNHLLWPNRSRARAFGSERQTFGRLCVQRLAGSAGGDIILEARREGKNLLGWFVWSQVQQLMLWRDNGTSLTLNYDNDIRIGIIPMDGIEIEPVFLRSKTIDPAAKCAGVLIIKEA